MFEWLLFCGVMFVAISFVLIGVWCEKLKEYIGSVVYVFTIPYTITAIMFIGWCWSNLRFAFTFVWG